MNEDDCRRLLWWDDASYIRYQSDPGDVEYGPEDFPEAEGPQLPEVKPEPIPDDGILF